MLKHITAFAALSFALATTLATGPAAMAQEEQPATAALSPNQIVASAEAKEWMAIPADNLLVMTLAPDAKGNARAVVIQLMPAPFSQGWVENIRTLARANWYDGVSVNRVQDNYVVQWGDPDGEDDTKAKPLPEGLKLMREDEYVSSELFAVKVPGRDRPRFNYNLGAMSVMTGLTAAGTRDEFTEKTSKIFSTKIAPKSSEIIQGDDPVKLTEQDKFDLTPNFKDRYADRSFNALGWPLAAEGSESWPVHCYGMVGVGRNYSPDTGSGAELYTVIGHAPRHLDRNIALVGRIIEGMEHLSSLPRGSGELGFYTEEEAGKRTPIQSVRVVSDLEVAAQPAFEYLQTEGPTFLKYTEARAKRHDPFFIKPAGGADICNIPVPIRRVGDAKGE